MSLPRINSYGQYSSDNYGAHCLVIDWGRVTVWYSYRTPVAFRVDGHNRVVHRNDWGPTTGKHLKWIDGSTSKDAKHRVDGEMFDKLWKEQVEPIFNPKEEEKEAVSEFRIPVIV